MTLGWKLGPAHFTLDTDISGLVDQFCHLLENPEKAGVNLGTVAFRSGRPEIEGFSGGLRSSRSRAFTAQDGASYVFDREKDVCYVSLPRIAKGTIAFSESSVSWELEKIPKPRSTFHILVLNPLTLFAPAHRLMIHHAAAITVERDAILLFGHSGIGKSTLTFLLSHSNTAADLCALSDDVVIMDFREREVVVWPINTGFGLSEEILTASDLDIHERNIIQRSRNKLYLRCLPKQSPDGPYVVKRVVFLERDPAVDDGTRVQELDANSTLKRLLMFHTSMPRPYLVAKLDLCRSLARQAKGTVLSFGDYCDPDTVTALVPT